MLAFVFGSLLAFLPLLMAVPAILTSFLAAYGLTTATGVSPVVQFLIALIGLGVAIDYALIIVVRWREQEISRSGTAARIAASALRVCGCRRDLPVGRSDAQRPRRFLPTGRGGTLAGLVDARAQHRRSGGAAPTHTRSPARSRRYTCSRLGAQVQPDGPPVKACSGDRTRLPAEVVTTNRRTAETSRRKV